MQGGYLKLVVIKFLLELMSELWPALRCAPTTTHSSPEGVIARRERIGKRPAGGRAAGSQRPATDPPRHRQPAEDTREEESRSRASVDATTQDCCTLTCPHDSATFLDRVATGEPSEVACRGRTAGIAPMILSPHLPLPHALEPLPRAPPTRFVARPGRVGSLRGHRDAGTLPHPPHHPKIAAPSCGLPLAFSPSACCRPAFASTVAHWRPDAVSALAQPSPSTPKRRGTCLAAWSCAGPFAEMRRRRAHPALPVRGQSGCPSTRPSTLDCGAWSCARRFSSARGRRQGAMDS